MSALFDNNLLQTIFQHGDLELKGQFTLGSNYTFLVDVTYQDSTYPAVYKPTRGKQPEGHFCPKKNGHLH